MVPIPVARIINIAFLLRLVEAKGLATLAEFERSSYPTPYQEAASELFIGKRVCKDTNLEQSRDTPLTMLGKCLQKAVQWTDKGIVRARIRRGSTVDERPFLYLYVFISVSINPYSKAF
ncbi:hypothetical protein BJ878DRAFT_104368 [Calycina marina]|uniref:Uncharacterized protein n=1 Tax=Calycina marina TaxID=1763456 RepID=A0A9P7Z294_9HELO|nr:hypothetical protein BJ878DRAFT_104368 [Calycina marina]